jgi:hypothetical protein
MGQCMCACTRVRRLARGLRASSAAAPSLPPRARTAQERPARAREPCAEGAGGRMRCPILHALLKAGARS